MRRHQHRDPEGSEPGDEREHLVAAGRIETTGRFVEKHELGVGDDRLRELRALAHAGRELADRPEARLVEPHEIENVGRPLARGARRQAAQLAERRNDVGSGLIEGQAVVLGHVAQPRADPDRIAGNVETAHLDVAFGGVREPEQEPERRRLPGAVRPDQTDPPARHVETQIVERRRTRIPLRQPLDAEQ